SLLLREQLNLAAIQIGLRHHAGRALFRRLFEQRFSSGELCASRINSCLSGDDLKVRSTDREHDQIARVRNREFVSTFALLGRTIIVSGGHIENRLRKTRPYVEKVEWSNDRRHGKTRNRSLKPETKRAQICLLHGLTEIGVDVWQQRAASNFGLPA